MLRRAGVLVVCLAAFLAGVFVWIDDRNRLTPVCLAVADESTAQKLGPAAIAALSTFCGGGRYMDGGEMQTELAEVNQQQVEMST